MITLSPIIHNDEIIGHKRELIHTFDMEYSSGKTSTILRNARGLNGCNAIILDIKNNNKLYLQVSTINYKNDDVRYFSKSDIEYLSGQEIDVLYVDEWFDLRWADRAWIINWCKSTNTYLNAYGSNYNNEVG